MVNECNAPLATRKRAVLVAAKNQGLAFVVVEREDGSRSGETAPGRSRGGREQQRRRRRTKPLASFASLLTYCCLSRPSLEKSREPQWFCFVTAGTNTQTDTGPANVSIKCSGTVSALASLLLACQSTSATLSELAFSAY